MLELVDAKGAALDSVAFDVRGAQARPAAPPARRSTNAARPTPKPVP